MLRGTGVVGGRIARLAEARGVAERVVRVSRRPASGAGEVSRRADVADPVSLRAAIADACVVVNAVGPFTYDPAAIVAACAAIGAHYVDVAEVEGFRAAVAEQARREVEAGRAFAAVSGASTIPGLVELLARDLAKDTPAALVRAYLAVGTRNPVSGTLVASMLEPLGRPLPEARGAGIDGGAPRAFASLVRKRHEGLGVRIYGRYPSGTHGADVGGLGGGPARTLPVEQYFGCDRGVYGAALWGAARVFGRLEPAAGRVVSNVAFALAPIARVFGTSTGTLLVELLDDRGCVLRAVELRAHREGMDVPALPAVWAASALGGGRRGGSLADVVSAAEALADLARHGVEVRRYGAGGVDVTGGSDA